MPHFHANKNPLDKWGTRWNKQFLGSIAAYQYRTIVDYHSSRDVFWFMSVISATQAPFPTLEFYLAPGGLLFTTQLDTNGYCVVDFSKMPINIGKLVYVSMKSVGAQFVGSVSSFVCWSPYIP